MVEDFKSDKPKSTILVVEDFEDSRLLMKVWLEKKGFRVLEAEDGEQAVAVALRELPDLIIMDVEMPRVDGLTATRQLRQHESLRDVPVIMVSAYTADEYRAAALEAGSNEYVSTPFEVEKLGKLIDDFLSEK
jgi:two-component system cell cycle response regulator DivK